MTTVLELVLLRHPETQWNKDKLLQGQSDIPPLNPIVPDELVDALLDLGNVVAVYTSDLLRCRLPAYDLYRKLVTRLEGPERMICSDILQSPLPYVETPLLRERSFGAWEGKSYAELGFEDVGSVGTHLYELHKIPDGEDIDYVGQRAAAIAKMMILCNQRRIRYDDINIVPVIGHNCILNYIITALLQRSHDFDSTRLSPYRPCGNLSGVRVQIDEFNIVRDILPCPK